MRVSALFLFASTAAAFSMPDFSNILPRQVSTNGNGGNGRCPSVWTDVSKELTKQFLTNGQCNPSARAAIRLVFHDCGAWNQAQGAKGGCDGSLILSNELSRPENAGLARIASYIQGLATRFKTSVADMIVFAGHHAIVTCPGGPQVQTFIGRKDSKIAAPKSLLPDVNAPAASLFKLFQDKGFDAGDLAALLGAHSTSNQFNFDTSPNNVGKGQDSTPGIWDVKYYSDTLKPPRNVLVLPSDAKLAADPTVGRAFRGFVGNSGRWNARFAKAMGQMSLFGSSGTRGLVDCTGALPRATNRKREMRGMPVFASRNQID